MPSLVKYAHEILSEDRYGFRALERVDERIGSLNDAQLVGMVTHLSGSMSRAKSELWRYANKTVLESVKEEVRRQAMAPGWSFLLHSLDPFLRSAFLRLAALFKTEH